MDELDEARAATLADRQYATAVSASMGKAKLMGLLVERKETGKPGEFANMSVEQLRKQLDEDLAALEAFRKARGETSH